MLILNWPHTIFYYLENKKIEHPRTSDIHIYIFVTKYLNHNVFFLSSSQLVTYTGFLSVLTPALNKQPAAHTIHSLNQKLNLKNKSFLKLNPSKTMKFADLTLLNLISIFHSNKVFYVHN